MTTPFQVFFWLMVGHAVADCILNSATLSNDKNRHVRPHLWLQAMTAHCLTNAGAVALATGSVRIGVNEFVAHFVIDSAKCEGWIGPRTDQCLHFACKVLWVLWWMWR